MDPLDPDEGDGGAVADDGVLLDFHPGIWARLSTREGKL